MIVGFGENSVDIVYRLPSFPQPGPGSKMRIADRGVRCGGQVATTLATCADLGLRTRYVGVFGDDDNGTLIRGELTRRGVDVSRALVRLAPNRYAVILIDATRGERIVLWDKDPRLVVTAADVQRDWIADATLLHVDATDEEAAIALARMAREAAIPVTCDVDHVTPRTRDLLDTVTLPVLAEELPATLTGRRDVDTALRAIQQPHHTHVVVTLGARGAAMLIGDRYIESPGVPVDVVDTTGAGDVFRGALIAALLRGDGPEEMLRFANGMAAESCARHGAM
jgi:sugar/nucleoside kinase (ribokinase family)